MTAPPPPPFTVGKQIVPTELRDDVGRLRRTGIAERTRRGRRQPRPGRRAVRRRPRAPRRRSRSRSSTARRCKARPAFDLLKEYLDESFDLQTTSEVCRVPTRRRSRASRGSSRANKGKALLAAGMGPNHYFNNDLFGRVHFLVAALTDNIGHIGGNVGSYAGNYRGSLFQAMPQWILENPFDIEPDLTKPARVKKYYKAESAHYWNYGERPLRAFKTGTTPQGESITGKTPHADADEADLVRQLELAARQREVVVRRRQEHAAAAGRGLLQRVALDELVRVLGHRLPGRLVGRVQAPGHDGELHEPVPARVPDDAARADPRLALRLRDPGARGGASSASSCRSRAWPTYWKGVLDGDPTPYLQRILAGSNATRGVLYDDLHASVEAGRPAADEPAHVPARTPAGSSARRTSPGTRRPGGSSSTAPSASSRRRASRCPSGASRSTRRSTSRTRSSRTSRAPVDHAARPEDYGVPESQRRRRDAPVPQRRAHLGRSCGRSKHPLHERDPAYRFIFQTPKYRWGAHSTAVDADWIAMLFGPFGDPYRRDPRTPVDGRGVLRDQPARRRRSSASRTATTSGSTPIPTDRPYRGLEGGRPVLRRRPGDDARPRLLGHAARRDPHLVQHVRGDARHGRGAEATCQGDPAQNPVTRYVALFRHGSHQSGTRAYLRPTQMTETLTPQDLLRPGHRHGLRGRRPLRLGSAEGGVRQDREGRGRRHAARRSCGARSRSASGPRRPSEATASRTWRAPTSRGSGVREPCRRCATGSSGARWSTRTRRPGRSASSRMIMDTNKCIACQSCTIACKSTWTWGKGQEYMLWNNIETKPFGFYPTGWDVNVLELLGEQHVGRRHLRGADDLRGGAGRRARARLDARRGGLEPPEHRRGRADRGRRRRRPYIPEDSRTR